MGTGALFCVIFLDLDCFFEEVGFCLRVITYLNDEHKRLCDQVKSQTIQNLSPGSREAREGKQARKNSNQR